MKKVIIILALIIGALGAGYFGVQHHEKQAYLASPSYALTQLEQSVKDNNYIAFTTYANAPKLTDALLQEILKDDTPEQPKDAGILGAVTSTFNKKFTDYIQPELRKNLSSQLKTFIEGGTFKKEIDITSLYSKRPLLEKIWLDLSGKYGITFVGFSDINQTSETTATAVATFHRKDLDYKAPFEITLNKKGKTWQLAEITNFSKILERIEDLTAKIKAEKERKLRAKINESVAVPYTTKSNAIGEFGLGANIMLGIAFENTSKQNISYIKANVEFKNAAGDILRTVVIQESDLIESGNIVEKSWPMPLNPLSSNDEYIFNAKETNMTVTTHVNELHFENGEKLVVDAK